MYAHHRGICTVPTPEGIRVHLTERDVKQGVKQAPYGPGLHSGREYTAYEVTVRNGRRVITMGALIRGVCTSPLGALFGLALLALCWLAGCA